MVPVKGSGAYSMPKSMKPLVKQALQELGAAAGSSLGSYVGQSSRGAMLGKTIAAKISKLVGSGDYTVSDRPVVNSLFPGAGGGGNGYAQFSNASQSTRIMHREYLQDIYTSSTPGQFNIAAFNVNPGLAYTFPYLASIAQNFEEYRVRGMVFEFIATASPYSSASAMGTTIMAMEYNAAAPAFTNKPQMENSDFAISARFDRNMVYGVECSMNAQNTYYVRSGQSVLPLTSTDLGTMYVATQPSPTYNATSAVNVGELWVSYDVEFYRPRITPARFGYFHLRGSVAAAGTPVFGTAAVDYKLTQYGTLSNVAFSQSGNNLTLTFPNADPGDIYSIQVIGQTAPTGTWSGGAGFLHTATGFADVMTLGGFQAGGSYSSLSANTGRYLQANDIVVVNSNYAGVYSIVLTIPNTITVGGDVDIILTDIGNGFDANTL